MMLGQGLDPELVAQIQALTGGSPYGGVPMAGSYGGPGDTAAVRTLVPAMQPDPSQPEDGMSALRAIGGILTSPFRLIGAAKEGLEDAIGHPNAIARQQHDAQYDMTLKYLLASNSIPDDVKRLLPGVMPPTDRSGYVGRQTSTDATATGRSYDDLPTPEPRRMGVLEWMTGEDRRQRARDEATVQAAMKLAGIDYRLQKDSAEVRRLRTAGDFNDARTAGQWWKNEQGYRYDDRDRILGQTESTARAGASNASAYNSAMHGNQARDSNAREATYFDQVRLPGGLAGNDQRGQYHDLRMQTGQERLNQLRAQGPVDLQTKEARLAKAGGAPGTGAEIPKDYVNLVKARNVAVNQARDDYNKQWHLPTWLGGSGLSFDPSEIDASLMIPHKDDGTPDWEAVVDRVRVKPMGAQPDTASAAPTGRTAVAPSAVPATRNPAVVAQINRLLKQKMPGMDDGIITGRADLIAEAMPKLDFSSEDAFLDSAELAGISQPEQDLLWENFGPR